MGMTITGTLVVGLVLGGLVTQSAQPTPSRPASQGTPDEGHAAIGTIKQLDLSAGMLTITTLAEGERVFRLTEMTALHGLGINAQLHALTGREGASVWVHYVGEVRAVARAVQYIGREDLLTARGTLVRVLPRSQEVVVRTAQGAEQRFLVSERAPIDLVRGLVRLNELAEYRDVPLTVYFTKLGQINVAWLVQQQRSRAVS